MDKKKIRDENARQAALQFGNDLSKNVQDGTQQVLQGMNLFRNIGNRLENVGYEQGKGNLFEFIEAAKLTKNMANAGVKSFDKYPVTDVPVGKGGFGEHTAPDDFRMIKNGEIIGRGQAKVNNNAHKAAVNFTNKKYFGMQKNTTVDSVPEIRQELNSMLKKGEISKVAYNDAVKKLENNGMLTDPESGITSGGTMKNELEQFRGPDGKVSKKTVEKYAKKFEFKQYGKEIVNTASNMAAANAVTAGIISGVENTFAVIQNRKNLDAAIKDVGVSVVKNGARGGITGALSSILRIGGQKAKLPVLSDSSAATVIAAGIIDSGVAIYEYARGEIDSAQLAEQLKNTVIKSTATIYFTKAVTLLYGSAGPFVPIAIYSVANYVVASTQEIIKNAKLNAAEYDRLTALNQNTTELVKSFHRKLVEPMTSYEQNQKKHMTKLLEEFDNAIISGNGCDSAIYAMIEFANDTGIALQHTDFNDFSDAMVSSDSLVLGKADTSFKNN